MMSAEVGTSTYKVPFWLTAASKSLILERIGPSYESFLGLREQFFAKGCRPSYRFSRRGEGSSMFARFCCIQGNAAGSLAAPQEQLTKALQDSSSSSAAVDVSCYGGVQVISTLPQLSPWIQDIAKTYLQFSMLYT